MTVQNVVKYSGSVYPSDGPANVATIKVNTDDAEPTIVIEVKGWDSDGYPNDIDIISFNIGVEPAKVREMTWELLQNCADAMKPGSEDAAVSTDEWDDPANRPIPDITVTEAEADKNASISHVVPVSRNEGEAL